MKIFVCIKQVPGTTQVETDQKTGTLKRAGLVSVINPFDLYAIETAVRLKERYGGEVTAVSMGPPQAQHALKDAVALGCDKTILLSDRAFAGADTVATSYTLAKGLKSAGGFDLILCGIKTVDGDTAQVGPMIAEELDVPAICNVKKIEVNGRTITVDRTMDFGYEVLEAKMPCLLTVVKEISEPRMPTLEEKLRSKRHQIKTEDSKTLKADECQIGLKGSPTQVLKVFSPEKRGGGEIIQTSPKEAADTLIARLIELKVVK
jgi:electron transfer flavoprotein alpha/beta subunit